MIKIQYNYINYNYMNIDNYNFYGNYGVEDKSFSIYEIHKKQREKEIRKIKLYKKILNRCFYKIRLAVEKDQLYCFYQLPEYISGSPLYNMTDCLFFIINELSKKGFNCKYCHPLQVYITWPQKKKNLRLDFVPKNKNNNMIDTKIKKLEKEMNLNYRSVNNYTPTIQNIHNMNGSSNIDINFSNSNESINEIKNKFDNLPINNKNIVLNRDSRNTSSFNNNNSRNISSFNNNNSRNTSSINNRNYKSTPLNNNNNSKNTSSFNNITNNITKNIKSLYSNTLKTLNNAYKKKDTKLLF